MTDEERGDIWASLNEKGAMKPCPRCGHADFGIVNGFFVPMMSEKADPWEVGDRGMPCAAVGCLKCGYMCMHAMGVLVPKKSPAAAIESEQKPA